MKVLFVGIGSIAGRHISNLKEICDRRAIDVTIDALRRDGSQKSRVDDYLNSVYTSFDEVPSDYDVIFLTNPTEYHAEMLIKLHDHSQNFFIEKPIATIGTLELLDDLRIRDESIYYVACPMRYTNVIRYVRDNIDISKINSVRSISSSYLPEWRPDTDYRLNYSANTEMGGGVDIDLIHEWDYLSYLFGKPSDIKYFKGRVSKLEIDSSDYAIYIARFNRDMVCELHLDYFGRKEIRTMELFMDDDTVVGDFIADNISFLKSGRVVGFKDEEDLCQYRELDHFIDTIICNGKSDNDIDNAIRILKLTQGIIA